MRKFHARGLAVVSTLCLTLLPWCVAEVRGDKLREDTSLQWAPMTVGFYASTLRAGEQWDNFTRSKAYEKLNSLPMVQMAIGQIHAKMQEASGDFGQLMSFLNDPSHAELVKLAKDMLRHEVVILGDDRVGNLIYELNQINRTSTKTQLAALKGGGDPQDAEKAMLDAVIKAAGEIEIPNLFLGFKVADEALAKRQIPLLEKMLRQAVEDEAPHLAGMLKSREINGSPILQVTVTGDMIPWDKLNEDEDFSEEQLESLKKSLSGREVNLSVGVHRGYLYALLGALNDPIRIFSSNKLLIDRPELKRLRDMDGKAFTSIAFVSDDFMHQASRPQDDIDQLVAVADALVPKANLEEELQTSLISDAKELAEDLKSVIPKTGAVLSFEYETDEGYEGFTQNWTENLHLDGSKVLDVLQHMGGDPIALLVGRTKKNDRTRGMMSKWCGKAMHYAEVFASKSKAEEEDLALYNNFKEAMQPLGDRFAEIGQKYFAPAMEDGQAALLVDSKLEPKAKWHPAMPEGSGEPLGMLEFAQVYGVADAQKLETAFSEYKTLADDAIDKLKEVTQENQEALMEKLSGQAAMLPMVIQSLQLPTPNERELDKGKLYYLGGLAAAGVDPSLAPAWGWSDKVLVIANSPDTVTRVLETKPIEGPLAEMAGGRLAAAAHLNLAKLMSVLKPWVRYGLAVAAQQQDNQMISMVAPQVEAVMDVVSCFRQHTSVTFEDGNSLVTHYRQEVRDLE